MFRHLPDVFPVLVQREAHHREDPIQLKTRNQSVFKTLSGEQVFFYLTEKTSTYPTSNDDQEKTLKCQLSLTRKKYMD